MVHFLFSLIRKRERVTGGGDKKATVQERTVAKDRRDLTFTGQQAHSEEVESYQPQ